MSDTIVGIRELKSHLSEYLRRVKAGQTVVITERGKPIGRILPVERSLEECMQALVNAGLAEWSGKKYRPREPKTVNQNDQQVSDLVVEDRRIDYLP